MRNFGKNANLDDIATAIGLMLMLVLTLFFVWTVVNEFNTRIDTLPDSGINVTNSTKQFIDEYQTNYLAAWDLAAIMLAIFLPIASLMLARKIPTSPVFMIFIIMWVGFIILMAMIAANVYGAFIGDVRFDLFIAQTKFIPIIMPNMVYWVMIYIAVVLYGLYTKEEA